MKLGRAIAALILCSVFMSSAATQPPTRQGIAVPPVVEAIVSAQMNGHLVSLDSIIAALSERDYERAASAAREMSIARGQDLSADPSGGPGLGIGQHLPEGFRNLGREFHEAAAEYAQALSDTRRAPESVRPEKLFEGLAKVTNACRSCHDAYTFD